MTLTTYQRANILCDTKVLAVDACQHSPCEANPVCLPAASMQFAPWLSAKSCLHLAHVKNALLVPLVSASCSLWTILSLNLETVVFFLFYHSDVVYLLYWCCISYFIATHTQVNLTSMLDKATCQVLRYFLSPPHAQVYLIISLHFKHNV